VRANSVAECIAVSGEQHQWQPLTVAKFIAVSGEQYQWQPLTEFTDSHSEFPSVSR
jgi:hypothetical protein